MTDDMLVALSRNNGVAMVNFNCGFISDDYNKRSKQWSADHPDEIIVRRRARFSKRRAFPFSTVEAVNARERTVVLRLDPGALERSPAA